MKIVNFFDKLEDNVRGHLSRYPIVYSVIGGVAIVLFWRGVWHTADILERGGGIMSVLFSAPISLAIVVFVLLVSGLFVSYFIGDSILISGLRREKKIHEKTVGEVRDGEATLGDMKKAVNELKDEIVVIKEVIEHEHGSHNFKSKRSKK